MNVIGLPPVNEFYAFEPLVALRVHHRKRDPCLQSPIEDEDDTSSSSSSDDDCCCQASITTVSTESEGFSSFDESLTKLAILPLSSPTSSSSSSSAKTSQTNQTKRSCVTFQDHIEIREYAVTIGDHPCCLGGLPLTLDWYHTASSYRSLKGNDDSSSSAACAERLGHSRVPRKLTYEQRKERLRTASARNNKNGNDDSSNSDDDDDNNSGRNEHVDLVMKVLECSWSNYRLLPLPKFEALEDSSDSDSDDSDSSSSSDDDDDEYYRPIQPSRQQLVHWKRVMKRSEAFMQ